ncbi:hypothetical protein SATRM34S_00133 [Streptomyces atroolivaceus]
MSSNCSRRASDNAPAVDSTARPSARRCSISAALRAAARWFFSQMPARYPWYVASSGARRCPLVSACPRAAARPSSHATEAYLALTAHALDYPPEAAVALVRDAACGALGVARIARQLCDWTAT